MLSMVLPKGSLERSTLELFEQAGIYIQRPERSYRGKAGHRGVVEVRFLRPREIVSYVESGQFDLGVTGSDWIVETKAKVHRITQFSYSSATRHPSQIVLALPEDHPSHRGIDLPEGIRVATEYPRLTRECLCELGVSATVIQSFGATEAKVPDLADAIVDVVETGRSLRANGLKAFKTLMISYPELIASISAWKDPQKRSIIEELAWLLRGVADARKHALLTLEVPISRIPAVVQLLPKRAWQRGTALNGADFAVIETVIPKSEMSCLVRALIQAGIYRMSESTFTSLIGMEVGFANPGIHPSM